MKSNRFLNLLLGTLQVFMQMCVAVTLTNMLLHGFMGYETFHVFNTLYISFPVLIYYLAKSFVKNGKIATAIHLAGLFSTLVIPKGPAEELAMIFVPGLIFMFYSLKRSNERPLLPFEIGILIGGYIFGGTIATESALVIPTYATVFYVVSYAIWYNIYHLNLFVIENGGTKSFNAEQAVNVNSVMLAIFVVACVAMMFLMPALHLHDFFNWILKGIIAGVAFVVRLWTDRIPQGDEIVELPPETPKGPVEPMEEMEIFMEMTHGSEILNWIAAIFALVIFIFMMILLVRALKDVRYRKSQGLDVKEFVKPEFGKKDKAHEKRAREPFFWNVPNDMLIRKMYQKSVKKNLKKGDTVDAHLAPTQITKTTLGWNEQTESMTLLYEKARYSLEEISKEDIAHFQRNASGK